MPSRRIELACAQVLPFYGASPPPSAAAAFPRHSWNGAPDCRDDMTRSRSQAAVKTCLAQCRIVIVTVGECAEAALSNCKRKPHETMADGQQLSCSHEVFARDHSNCIQKRILSCCLSCKPTNFCNLKKKKKPLQCTPYPALHCVMASPRPICKRNRQSAGPAQKRPANSVQRRRPNRLRRERGNASIRLHMFQFVFLFLLKKNKAKGRHTANTRKPPLASQFDRLFAHQATLPALFSSSKPASCITPKKYVNDCGLQAQTFQL